MSEILVVPEYLRRKNPQKKPLEIIIEQKEKLESTLLTAQIQLNQLNVAIERLVEQNSSTK